MKPREVTEEHKCTTCGLKWDVIMLFEEDTRALVYIDEERDILCPNCNHVFDEGCLDCNPSLGARDDETIH